jgi:hypothetical protein
MSEDKAQIEAQISELISSNLTADDADSGWVVAYMMTQALPVLKDIAATLGSINEGIAPTAQPYSVRDELHSIFNVLDQMLLCLRKGK